MISVRRCLCVAAVAFAAMGVSNVFAANVLETYFAPFPEDDMQTSLKVINAFQGNIGNEVRTATSMVAGNDGTVIYYDHWEDGYEDDISNPTQATTEVWGDGNDSNGIPPDFAADAVDAGTIINLEATIDVTRNEVIFEYDGRDKIAATLPISMSRAMYPIDPGEVIAEAGTALAVNLHGTNYVIAAGWGTGTALYTNEVFEYSALYIMADYDGTYVEVDKDADGIYETTAWLDQGQSLFINGGVVVGARARGNVPFQCHLVTGDIYSNYETRWYTQWPVEKWSSDYYSPVGSRSNVSAGILYRASVFFYNANTSSIDVVCETAASTTIVTVAASSVSGAYTLPINSGARFRTTNGLPFFTSEVVDSSTPAYSGQLQDYDWGFSVLPADALTTMGIVSWGPGYGVTGSGTVNGSPAWVIAMSNTTLYVDLDGDPTTGPLTDPLGNQYNYTTNMTRFQYVQLFDNTDTNQTGMRFYTLDGTKISSAWGEDPGTAQPGLPYLDAGNELMPFPSILAKKYSILLIDLNTNGVPDPGDSLEFMIDVYNVGFATANNVIFQDTPPTNTTAYTTNSSTVNGVPIFDDLPPRLTRFPFDEGGYNIGTIDIRGTSRVTYVTMIVSSMPTNFSGYIHNNATVTDSNGNWIANSFTNVIVDGMTITKTASTTNLLNPGDLLTYTITVANTGQLTYTGVRLEDALPEGVTYVDGTTEIVYPVGLTNTCIDRFDIRAYTNQNGTLPWLNDWQEVGEADGAGSGDVQVAPDTNVVPLEAYALYVGGSNNMAWRSADLSGHSSAFLSFNYRRRYLDDANDYFDLYISTNGWASSNFLVRYQGAANDTNYLYTNVEISAYISTNTSIRFQSSRSPTIVAEDRLFVDNVMISLIGSNVTFAGGTPPLLFNGLSLPPNTSIVVRFDVRVNNPATATQFVNTARTRAEQHKSWLYAYHVTNRVNARASLQLFKTNSPAGLVGPGSNILYTIRIVNTGDVQQTAITLEDILPPGVTYVPNSAEVWRPFLHTNYVRDLFNAKAYTNNDGILNWLGDWTETGDDNSPTSGTIQVANDGDSVPAHVFALSISTADSIVRLADLGGGYTNAWLSLQYRREGPEAGEYVRIDASANGGGAWTEVGRINGPGTDSAYYTSNMNITAYIATNTAIRLIGVGLEADDFIWFDDIRINFSGSNSTNDLPGPPTMFEGYSLPPYTSMVVTLRVTVDDPPVSTQMINTAQIQSAQHPDWLYAYATNYQNFNAGMTIAKTSSLAGANWPLYYTNTYTITLSNTGMVEQTGITVTDALPAGVSYVPGSAMVVSPVFVTNVTTNVTAITITNTVRDEFDARSYANNDGTVNWAGNWNETGDDGSATTGDVLVTNRYDTYTLVTKDNENGAWRQVDLTGYTNAILTFDWARFQLDAADYYAVYVSSNGGTAYSQLIQYNGSGGDDAALSSTNFNITPWMSANTRVRFYSADTTVADEEGMAWDNVQILFTAPSAVTNFTTNITWAAVTNAGDAPPPVASGYNLPTGRTMTVTLKVTLDLPTSYTQFLNTAIVNSYQQGQREAYATDRVARITIGDFVWYDVNTNGIQNAGEPGISNVTVRLYDAAANLLASTNTDATGYYLFSGWPGTNYFVEFVAPTGFWFTLRDQGGSDTNDSDPDPATGRTAIFTNAVTTNDLKWDAGLYQPPATIGDWVWFDANTNGIQNAGESGVTNVVVKLYDSVSNLVAVTTNNATGYYSFTGLLSGYYFLEFLPPSNYVFTLQDQGGSDTNDSDVSQSTGFTIPFFLSPGTNDLKWDAGLVQPQSGLRITKVSDAGGICWDPGETSTYTIVVANTGTFTHVGVTVEDAFPAGTTFVTNSITVRGPVSGLTGAPPVLAYGYTLAAGQAITVTVKVAIGKPAITNSLLNVASTYSATQPSISASATDCVVYADLGVIKDVSDSTPNEVEILEYSITITNIGPDPATSVEIEDVLPAEVQYNSHSNGTYSESTHIWTIGNLQVGGSTTLWINCTVREGTKGQYITNWASVYNLDQYDPVSTNDQDDAPIHPTLVVLSRFEVLSGSSGPVVEWETAYEHGTVGFILLRKADGEPDFVRLNGRLLPGVITAPQGGVYRLADPSAAPDRTYAYRLDEVTFDGTVNSYGPFTVTIPAADPSRNASARKAAAEPFTRSARTSTATQDRLARNAVAAALPQRAVAPKREAGNKSGSHDGSPVKVLTAESGMYRLDAATLAAAVGADEAEVAAALASNDVALSIGGEPVAQLSDGTSVCFFAEAMESIYATANVCRLTWTNGWVVPELGGIFPVPVNGGSFADTLHIEQDHFALLAVEQDAESDYWYWEYLIGGDPELGSSDYDLDPPGLAEDDGPAQLVVHLMGGTVTGVTNEHHVTVALNGTIVGEAAWTGLARFDLTNTFSASLLNEENTVTVTALLDGGAPWNLVYVNSMDLVYQREFKAVDDQLILRGDSNRVVSAFEFSTPNIRVLDITDPKRPVRMTGVTVDEFKQGYRATFAPGKPGTPYCVYAAGRAPVAVYARAPADLLSETNTARYIVITTPDLAGAAQNLADHRQSENGLPARVVLLEDIYDGFSAGVEHPPAIRDFLAWAFGHWNPADTNGFYVVLAGEGTFDYRNVMEAGQNKIPAMMVGTPYGLCASDGWYAEFNGDHVPDMAVGRLPVLAADELQALVDRIISYESAEGGAWRQTVLLSADNPDAGGNFDGASDAIGNLAPRDYAVEKVYLSALSTTHARTALQEGINGGTAFLNYFGHAGIDRLANEGLLRIDDMTSLTNTNRLPILVSLTCAMGQFALPGFDCLAETLMMGPGGAVAVWSPNGVSMNHSSYRLADGLYRSVFRQGRLVLGDATRQAMMAYAAAGGPRQVLDSYNLLGDPALCLRGTAFIGAGGYGGWKDNVFTDGELADPSISGEGSDPDGDGLVNLWEYATGWNARTADADSTIGIWLENTAYPLLSGEAVFEYQRRKGASDVQFVLQSSHSMTAWNDAVECVVGTDVVDDANGVTETVRVHVAVPEDQVEKRIFLRLMVERD